MTPLKRAEPFAEKWRDFLARHRAHLPAPRRHAAPSRLQADTGGPRVVVAPEFFRPFHAGIDLLDR